MKAQGVDAADVAYTMERVAFVKEINRLLAVELASKRIYYAAHWVADRSVDEKGLWEGLRDAAGWEHGNSPEPITED
jgi:hypothetical protein